jgi:hypothetical protein
MTTHDMQPEMVDPAVRADRPAEAPATERRMETDDGTTDLDAGDHRGGFTEPAQPSEFTEPTAEGGLAEPAESAQSFPPAPQAGAGATDQILFGDGELTDFHSRWTEVQAAFVDDPRDCVQKADVLVSDVVDRLTAGFSQARSQLEEQWSRGEQVSTEDLRIALQRYRDFFERLLAV